MNDKLKRLIATAVASLGLFAFAACNTDGDGETGTGTENSGGINNGTTGGNTGGNEGGNTGGTEGGSTGGEVVKPDGPVIPTVPAGAVKITKAAGDLESAYAIWDKVEGAMGYNVYCKIDGGEFVQLDAPLVREYKDYCRADAVGLKAGKYTLKVVPTGGAEYTEDEDKAATATDITVLAHERSGYAFVDGTASGAYNDDGTLKADADVVYVTDATKDTVTRNGVTGIQNILDAQKKSGKPLAIRLIGNITSPDITESKANNNNTDPNTLLIKGNTTKVNMQTTLEGIGSDATANGWTLRVTSSMNVEVRNIGFMNTKAGEPDDVTLEKDNHVWVHNCDLFYGGAGGDKDQAKGDGALDTKESAYITHSYNHFWDSGKCNLQGMKSEYTTNYITYHHNWYDHSDSRHPRIRTCTTHVYNNYFDGNAKYGVGITTGASAFVENNYFRSNAKMRPMMTAGQGTDANGSAKGTFSGEDGGVIKAYGNKFDGQYELVTQNDTSDKTDIDCYEASLREETVSSEYTAKKGGTSYSNFDTASNFYEYTVDTPEVAKEKVETYAGRVDGGDFKWEFNNATEDSNYAIISALKTALGAYKSDLVKVGGVVINSGTTGGTTGGEGEGGGDNSGGTVPEGVSKVEFIRSNEGNYPAGITVSGSYKSGTDFLKMETSTKVTVTVEKDTVITIHTTVAGKNIKLNNTNVKTDSNGECQITVKAGETLTIEKGDSMELEYILLN